MSTPKLNLILIPEKRMRCRKDFLKIAEIIKRKCTDVVPHVIRRRDIPFVQLLFTLRPSLYVAFFEANKFEPLRGYCFRGQAMGKSAQYSRLENNGIDTAAWQIIKPDDKYSAEEWGPYVIVKPDSGRKGVDVRIRKTGRIQYEKDCPDNQTFLIQKFIHTGPQPVSYRALTFFGEILYLQKSTNIACGNVLNDPKRADQIGGHNPVATSAKGIGELVFEQEIIDYAKQIAHKAFPEIPLLGQDIVRDQASGKLYCMEVNPYGSTWHFSSITGLSIQTANNFDYKNQFDAFNKVADILILKTREFAR